MAEAFDAYYKWLGIPPREQPPNHYRLLAINLFEDDLDVIDAAADRQMSHLRNYQTGQHSAASQKLLNECSAARITLLNPQSKAEYDRQLRGKPASLPLPPGEGRGEGGSPHQPVSIEGRPNSGTAHPHPNPLPKGEGTNLPPSPAPLSNTDRGDGGSPRPVPRAKPLPQSQSAAEPAPLIDVGASSPSARRSTHSRKKQPAWLVPVAGAGGIFALALVTWMVLGSAKSPDKSSPPGGTAVASSVAKQPQAARPSPRSDIKKDAVSATTTEPNREAPRASDATISPAMENDRWRAFDLGGNAVVDDFVRVTQGRLSTREAFDGPIEITVVARPVKNSIRLRAFHGGVIWNWEDNPAELRVGRPDQHTESAAVTPLTAGTWYRLKQRINGNTTDVYVDDKLVFHGTDGPYVGDSWPVSLETYERGSAFDVKSFEVRRLPPAGAETLAGHSADDSDVDLTLAPGVTMRLVKIPASADGKIKSSYLGQTEVTQKQWQAVMGSNPSDQKASELFPVHHITYDECSQFLDKLSSKSTHLRFRLPTKDEWFYAYEAGEPEAAHRILGAAALDYAWNNQNAGGSYDYHEVGTKKPNGWGLYDMLGSGWEWIDGASIVGLSVFDSMDEAAIRLRIVERTEVHPVEPLALGTISIRVAADLSVTNLAAAPDKTPPTSAANQSSPTPSPQPRMPGNPVLGNEPRLAVPDAESLKNAKQALQKKIAADVAAAKSPDSKRKLALELLHKAAAAEKRDAGVYVMFDAAIEMAEAAGDLDLAWQASDELAAAFAIAAPARRQQSLTQVAKAVKSAAQAYPLTADACLLLADALAAADAALVKKVAAQAQTLAKRAKDTALSKAVTLYARDANKLAGQIDALTQARETLKTRPDDAAANFTVGYYLFCAAGDHEHGLPKLAKAADESWRKPAADDLEASRNEVTPARRLAVADAWWSRGAEESWPAKHYMRLRAAVWYRRALESLAGGERTRASDRIKEFLADDDGLPKWELFRIERGEKLRACLRSNPEGQLHTCVEYGGPMEITLIARTDSLNIRLLVHGHEIIWNWEVNPRELRVQRPDGAEIGSPLLPLVPHRWYTLRYRIERQGTLITVDGLPVFTESHDYGVFPRAAIGVGRHGPAVVDVKKLVIKPLE